MAMPSAQQLFHKAIIQSGSALRVDSAQEADALASKCLSQRASRRIVSMISSTFLQIMSSRRCRK